MCLAALAVGLSPRFPLVIATNRDEFHARPADPMAWWSPSSPTSSSAEATALLAGRDLLAGGTWMGLTAGGRWGLLTNVRRPHLPPPPQAPSRGQIVPAWLSSNEGAETFAASQNWQRHSPFNLLAGDFTRHEVLWFSNDSEASGPQVLGPGVHGLSNALLNTPWPKVKALKHSLSQALVHAQAHAWTADALASQLLIDLADATPAPDSALPGTGVPLDLERALSSIFIHDASRGYGTRCSTVLIAERETVPDEHAPGSETPVRLTVVERTHAPRPHEGWHRLNWPAPRAS